MLNLLVKISGDLCKQKKQALLSMYEKSEAKENSRKDTTNFHINLHYFNVLVSVTF